jgi:radical SAM protein with 4Fe4S-binding SPASM domain
MLAYTRGKFLNLKMNTNASLLDERKCHALLQSGIKTLVFSADAAEEPLYSKLRVGGHLDKVLANIERFKKIKETQYSNSGIILRVSGVKFSESQNIESMEKLWGNLVDQVAFVAYNPWENTYNQAPSGVTKPCSDLWRRMFVWWDGKINPCDVDYKSTLSVGDLSSAELSGLWTSDKYARLRTDHLGQARGKLEPCRRCTVI